MTQSQPDPRRNQLDRYELIAEIARGGMGTVYLARLQGVAGFQRLFAIKLMHPHLASEQQFVTMLLDEARIAARIHHPNAVEIIDVCASPRGYYLVMPYVEGFTLEKIIEHPAVSRDQRVRFGLRLVRDAAVGLHAAHEIRADDGSPLGLVHRDVSPQNVLVGVDGVGRIADFGVARAAARITSSRPGTIKGKPCYMAPEQAKGAELDRRADVFALGIVLWEVLTRGQLFYSEAGDAAMLVRVLSDPIPLPSSLDPEIPEALDRICMKALDRDIDARYQTARELAEALDDAENEQRLMARHNEIADGLRALFGDEIEERRRAIHDHLSGLGRGSVPVVGSDVFDVPQLGHVGHDPARAPTRPSGPALPVATKAWHETPAEPAAAAEEAAPPTRERSPTRLAWLLVAVGLVLLSVAWLVAQNATDTTEADAGEQETPEEPLAPPPVPVPEPVAERPTQAAAPGEEPAAAEPAAATEIVTDTVGETVDSVERATSGILGGRARERAPRTKRTAMTEEPEAPALERNPYLSR